MSKRVIVVGSVNADIVVELERLPQRGETVSSSKPDTGRFFPGGKGANQAAAAANLISSESSLEGCSFAGQFGQDVHGNALQKALSDVGVDLSLSSTQDTPSGQAFVFVYPDGDNSIVIVGGANAQWPSPLPEKLSRAIQDASIVLLQTEIPAQVNAEVARVASEAGVSVMWDTGGEDRPIDASLLPYITYLCPNESELARLSNMKVETKDDAIAAARSMQSQGANHFLVTLGSSGSVFIPSDSNQEIVYQPCYKVDNVVDTTGAGDCYRAAFAVAIAEGKSIQVSMQQAAAASALCVQVQGAMPSMPTPSQVSTFLKE